MAAWLLLSLLLVAPGPSVSLEPRSACAPHAALARELRRLGLALVDDGVLQVRLTPAGEQVDLVLLRDGEVLLHRSFRGACEDAAGATAVVVERYLRELTPAAPPDAGVTVPPLARLRASGNEPAATPVSPGTKVSAAPDAGRPTVARTAEPRDAGVALAPSSRVSTSAARASAPTTTAPATTAPTTTAPATTSPTTTAPATTAPATTAPTTTAPTTTAPTTTAPTTTASANTASVAPLRPRVVTEEARVTPAPLVSAPAQPPAAPPGDERALPASTSTGTNGDEATGKASSSPSAAPPTSATSAPPSAPTRLEQDATRPADAAPAGESAPPTSPAPPGAPATPPNFALHFGGGFVTPAPGTALTPALSLEPQVLLGPWRVSLLGVFSFGGAVSVVEGTITRGTLASRDVWVLPSLGLCSAGRWSVCGALLVGGRMVFAEASGPYVFHTKSSVAGGLAAGAGADLTFTVGPLRLALSAALLVNPTPVTIGLVGLDTTLTTPVLEGLVRLSVGLGSPRTFP